MEAVVTIKEAYEDCLKAQAVGPFVFVSGVDGVAVSMTPEAVMGSLDPLRKAARAAIKNRDAGILVDDTP
jgi:hypothetical protein